MLDNKLVGCMDLLSKNLEQRILFKEITVF